LDDLPVSTSSALPFHIKCQQLTEATSNSPSLAFYSCRIFVETTSY